MKKGCFITFEGIDGSGKSTQIQKLNDFLTDQGFEVLITREPGGTAVGEKIRALLLDPENQDMCDMTEAYLYAAARAQLVREFVKPALAAGKIVLCDRFVDSSIAYQGFGRMMGDRIEKLNRFAVEDCMPDLTFLLRVEPSGGRQRIEDRALDRIELESMEFHDRTFRGYDTIAAENPERVIVVDGTDTIEAIHQVIRTKVATYVGLEQC